MSPEYCNLHSTDWLHNVSWITNIQQTGCIMYSILNNLYSTGRLRYDSWICNLQSKGWMCNVSWTIYIQGAGCVHNVSWKTYIQRAGCVMTPEYWRTLLGSGLISKVVLKDLFLNLKVLRTVLHRNSVNVVGWGEERDERGANAIFKKISGLG